MGKAVRVQCSLQLPRSPRVCELLPDGNPFSGLVPRVGLISLAPSEPWRVCVWGGVPPMVMSGIYTHMLFGVGSRELMNVAM